MNLAKLICGSQGTLGVMTNLKLSLVDVEKKSKMAVVFLNDIQDMPIIVEKIKHLLPESFEVFDDHTFRIAMKFLPQILTRLGGNIFSLAKLFWPEFKMLITGDIPKIVMLIEFVEKDTDSLHEKTSQLGDIFTDIKNDTELSKRVKTHIVKNDREAEKYWVFRRESFNLLRSKLKNVRTVPFIEDVVVHSADLSEFLPKFESLLDEHKLIYTIAGHVGDGNIHVIPLMSLKNGVDGDRSIQEIKNLSEKVYALVKQYGGSLSGEHNDGLIRSPFLEYMYTDNMIDIFTKIKNAFDPDGVFNPNKKITSVGKLKWEYVEKLIDRRK